MEPSIASQRRKKLKSILDVTTNIVVVVFALVAIGVLVKNYFMAPRAKTSVAITKGSIFPKVIGIDYEQAPRTLILALNVDCRYCSRSVPFYNSLSEAQKENANRFNMVAAFINKDAGLVKSYADENRLSVQTIAGIDLDKLGINMTPTVVLVDSAGKVLDSWRGALQADGEREILEALNLPYKAAASTPTAATNVKKNTNIFDEQKAALSISPDAKPQTDPNHFVEVFDVNGQGDIYLVYKNFMYQYDKNGMLKSSRALPADFRSPFCVDDAGNIYALNGKGLSVLSPELTKIRDVEFGEHLPAGSITLKMALDRRRNSLYLQTYAEQSFSQVLFKLDLKSHQFSEVYRLAKPVPFHPSYTPGAFDFAIGAQFLYISDIYQYKVYAYSLKDGSLARTIDQPYGLQPIEQEHGKFHVRKMAIEGLGQEPGLRNYPPIFHLSYTGQGHLLVWTSQRDVSGRQVVDVYDKQLKKLGTDLKFINPGRSNLVFLNSKVYVPDYGFGKPSSVYTGSPLEIPAAPFALKVFDASL